MDHWSQEKKLEVKKSIIKLQDSIIGAKEAAKNAVQSSPCPPVDLGVVNNTNHNDLSTAASLLKKVKPLIFKTDNNTEPLSRPDSLDPRRPKTTKRGELLYLETLRTVNCANSTQDCLLIRMRRAATWWKLTTFCLEGTGDVEISTDRHVDVAGKVVMMV